MAFLASTDKGLALVRESEALLLDLPYHDLGEALKAGMRIVDIESASVRTSVVLGSLALRPPVSEPSKIWGVGWAYADHRAETNFDDAHRDPIIFLKAPSSVVGVGYPIKLPVVAPSQVDYEGELAVVIEKEATTVSQEEAMSYVAGYTIGNDVSARDVQKGRVPGRAADTSAAKSFDTFTPMGPWLATLDSFQDPHDLRLRTWVDGELRQDARTSDLIYPVPEIVSYLSRQTTLKPGDVILTGTPSGVGGPRGEFLRAGSMVTIEIEGIGTLWNPVVGPRPEFPS